MSSLLRHLSEFTLQRTQQTCRACQHVMMRSNSRLLLVASRFGMLLEVALHVLIEESQRRLAGWLIQLQFEFEIARIGLSLEFAICKQFSCIARQSTEKL